MFHRVQAVPSVPGIKMCTSYGSLKSEKVELAYALFQNIMFCGLPVAAMLVCYPHMLFKLHRMQGDTGKTGRMVMKVMKHDVAINCSLNQYMEANMVDVAGIPRHWNMIGWTGAQKFKLSLLIGLVFSICWLPYHALIFL